MNIMRPITDPELPWTGTTFGLTVLATWHWCTDQVMVQRTLTSKNIIHAKAGCVLAACLKILPLWLLVFPRMIARILFPDEVACVDPVECSRICGTPAGCSNIAFVKLVLELMPLGVRGLTLAVMMAALMSSLTSVFNSASTIFTIDIWAAFRRRAWARKSPRQVEVEQVIVGRVSVFLIVLISVLWIPVIQNYSNSQLFVYAQSINSFLVPPITAIFVLTVFWKRTNEQGAFWGLMLGLVVGLIRFIMEFAYVIPPCGSSDPDPRPELLKVIVGRVNYLHFSILLFFLSLATAVAVSYVTPPIPEKCLHHLTFATCLSCEPRVSVREWRREQDGLDQPCSDGVPASSATQRSNGGPGETSGSLLARLCCLGARGGAQPPTDEGSPGLQEEDLRKKFMKEPSEEKWMVNISAVVSLLVVTFIYGFYS